MKIQTRTFKSSKQSPAFIIHNYDKFKLDTYNDSYRHLRTRNSTLFNFSKLYLEMLTGVLVYYTGTQTGFSYFFQIHS